MVLFLVGLFLGIVTTFFVLGLIVANDEEERRIEAQQIKMVEHFGLPDKCKSCPYRHFTDKPFDCAICHEFAEQ